MVDRRPFYRRNTLKLGLFSANLSSGRAATIVPERWSGSWDDCAALAQLVDDAGMDFLLSHARWKGYGGPTNFQGSSFETLTWATGMLALTKRITVFGTLHVALVHPLFAAKQMVGADHACRGRFALNVVCGSNADEFTMFGVDLREHDERYEFGREWLDIVKRVWAEHEPFDHDGRYFHLRDVQGEPKTYGGTRPVLMNAGASPAGVAFGIGNCDCIFTFLTDLESGASHVQKAKATARTLGREDVDVFSSGYVVCRPTQREAEEYHHWYSVEMGDNEAAENLIRLLVGNSQSIPPEHYAAYRQRFCAGHGSFPVVGSPDRVAELLAGISKAGYAGFAFSFVNYLNEFPYFRDEVLPRLERLGLREPVTAAV